MGKSTHRVRVWARRGDERTLEYSAEEPDSRAEGLRRVAQLQQEEAVDLIEMREHVVPDASRDEATPRRGSLWWERNDGVWHRVTGGPRR